YFGRLDVPPHRLQDLCVRQRRDLLLQLGLPGGRPVQIQILREVSRELRVLGARDLPALEITGLGFLDLGGGKAFLQSAFDLFADRLLPLLHVLGRIDRERGEASGLFQRRRLALRTDAGGETILPSDGGRNARVQAPYY